MENHFDQYRKELGSEGLHSVADLEDLVKPLIRAAKKMELISVNENGDSRLLSHFGGAPYFEAGEQWPTSKNGNPLSFIFQVYNNAETNLPADIALIQFYYCFDIFPWHNDDDGWHVKVYKKLQPEKMILLTSPAGLATNTFCKIEFKEVLSLPDWEGIDLYAPNASKLSCVLDEDQPWEHYQNISEKLVGAQNYCSQYGGYPHWVQGEQTPVGTDGHPMKLLFQIDSEQKAGLMWGDCGLVYIFYDEPSQRFAFLLQCF